MMVKSPARVYISGDSIQIGGSNEMTNKAYSQGEELIEKLRLSVEDLISKRLELEMKVNSFEV